MSEEKTISKLSNHYSFQNIPTIYDQEALTVLELVGRIAHKLNEVIDSQNGLGNGVGQSLKEQTDALEKALQEQEQYLREHIAGAKTIFSDNTSLETADVMEPGDYITQAGKVRNLPKDGDKESGFLSVRVSETEAMRYWVKQTWTSYVTGATYSRIYSRSTQVWTPWEALSTRICAIFEGSVDDLVESGFYVCDNVTESPYPGSINGVCMVRSVYNPNDRTGGRNYWVEQTYYSTAFPSRYAKRFKTSGVWGEWVYSGGGELLEETANLDDVHTVGCFTVPPVLVPDIVGKFKDSGQYYAMLTVRRFDGGGGNYWLTQDLTVLPQYMTARHRYSPFRLYRSYYSNSGRWTDWTDGTQAIAVTDPSVENADTLYKLSGHFWFPTGSDANKTPTAVPGTLDVEVYSYPTTPTQLVKQTFTKYSTSSVQELAQWVRMGSHNRDDGNIAWRPWMQVGTTASGGDTSGGSGNTGDSGNTGTESGSPGSVNCNCWTPELGTIVVMGDSIVGNYTGELSVCGGIQERTGANVVNCAFGGSVICPKDETTNWKPFSFKNLADAIKSGDFSSQDTALEALAEAGASNGGITPEIAERFRANLTALKTVDFNNVTTLVLCFGTNDWYKEKDIGEPASLIASLNNNVCASLRNGLSSIMKTYPHIRVVIASPCQRIFWDSDGNLTGGADTLVRGSLNLRQFCEKLREASNYVNIPFLDMLDIGINPWNHTAHFNKPDGTHPIGTTRKKMGQRIGSFIINL